MNVSDYDGVDGVDSDLALAPQRTSVLAILSLICAVICIIPGTGVLAIIFGISSLVGIGSSRGRVGGTGLAVSGLVLGLIVTLIQGAIGFGMFQVLNMFQSGLTQPAAQSLTALDAGDYKGARMVLNTQASAAVTDDQLQKFRAAYQAEMGAFKSIPQGWDIFPSYSQLGPIMQKAQSYNVQGDAIPVPASFDKGTGVLLLLIDKNSQGQIGKSGKGPTAKEIFPVHNFILLTPSGTVIELIPTGNKPSGDPSAPPAADAPSTPEPAPVPPATEGGK